MPTHSAGPVGPFQEMRPIMYDSPNRSAPMAPLAEAAVGRWTLDSDRSSITLQHTGFWGLAKIKGAFTRFSGEGAVLADGSAHGTLTVDAASVDTGITKRDAHLRTADFFDVANHASFVFRAIRVTPSGPASAEVTGELTVRGQTRPLSFTAQAAEASENAVTLTAEVDIARGDFGMTANPLGLMKALTTLTITTRFTRVGP
ncbi:YceI family protein [Streptomyces sp. NPDC046862]|uniref:YceI family protein n=1 Tax=Streptomyces sp. NPDC046862 TaxID=3154603 RepID=UPI00345112A0